MQISSFRLLQQLNKRHPIKNVLAVINLNNNCTTCYPRDNKVKHFASIKMELNNVFEGKIDRFKGITIHSDKENGLSVNEFTTKLENSLALWRNNGNRGIWFHINLEQADWIPVLARKGFKFHHANEEYVMMYLWLPITENCNIPHYAHTMLGVGAVVINEKNKVLVVREKYPFRGLIYWKLPGGYVEPGENLVDAAIREVEEETGILTEFQSILTLRHVHGGMFECSDIYTVVSLKPLSDDISKCDREIEECKWMPIEEYLNHESIHEINKFQLQKYLEHKQKNIKINCFHGLHSLVKKTYTLYSVTNADEKRDECEKKNGLIEDKKRHL